MGVDVKIEHLTKRFGKQLIWGDVTLTLPNGKTETGKFGWKDIQERNLPDGATIERTVLDDTLPGGPHPKKQRWVAPFATADRETDYAIAWEFFARQAEKEGVAGAGAP